MIPSPLDFTIKFSARARESRVPAELDSRECRRVHPENVVGSVSPFPSCAHLNRGNHLHYTNG